MRAVINEIKRKQQIDNKNSQNFKILKVRKTLQKFDKISSKLLSKPCMGISL